MIHTVEFRNFKALRHVKLDLERFTVLVGPNASGKTSILEGLCYLTRRSEQTAQPTISFQENPSSVWTRGAKEPIVIALEADEGSCKVEFTPAGFVPNSIPESPLESSSPTSWKYQAFNSKDKIGIWQPGMAAIPELVASFLRLESRRLAIPSIGRESEPRVSWDGEGLASALVYMRLNRPKTFDQLLALLRMVCPYVEGIRFGRVETHKNERETFLSEQGVQQELTVKRAYWADEILFDMKAAPNIPARMVSDGTLLILGLLAVIMGPDHPKLILLDDLDHGLHPRAQRDLVALLRKLLDQDPELQIVASTHSPYLLDQLEPKEVRLTTRLDDGSVACARLDEHPDFEKWKEAMTPGEFWSMVGEKWVGERQLEAAGS